MPSLPYFLNDLDTIPFMGNVNKRASGLYPTKLQELNIARQ